MILMVMAQVLMVTWEIHFQEGFLNDAVVVKVAGTVVTRDTTLTSDPVLGLAWLVLKIDSASGRCTVFVDDGSSDVRLSGEFKDEIEVSVIIDSENASMSFQKDGGSYIGVSKDRKGGIVFRQSKKPFTYD